jgi:hypothetical protein
MTHKIGATQQWNGGDDVPDVAKLGPGWPLAKSLCLLPTLYPASLAYGRNMLDPDDRIDPWRIRNLIAWHRPNPPVGQLGDKVRPSTSYVTTACVSDKRWFDLDAERTEHSEPGRSHRRDVLNRGAPGYHTGEDDKPKPLQNPAGAPPLDCWFDTADPDVWTIPTQPYKGSHYATFPIALPRRLIRLMCPQHVCTVCGEARRRITETVNAVGKAVRSRAEGRSLNGRTDCLVSTAAPDYTQVETLGWTDCGCHHRVDCHTSRHESGCCTKYRRGIVLDPFAGSGTTLAAAVEQGRDAIGIDLDERNLELARERIGLFLKVSDGGLADVG